MKTTQQHWLIMIALIGGCASTPQVAKNEQYLVKASALTKVAAALESAVRYKDVPVTLSEQALLEFATTHDPDLLAPFHGDKLRARRSGVLSSVLLCTKDGTFALIEDTGCTAKSDVHLWALSPRAACEYQLDLESVCKR